MKEKLTSFIKKVIGHRLASFWLALVSFAEASFFPIPPDILLMPMVALNKKRWLHYAVIATLYSVFGGLAGYAIGWLLFESVAQPIISFYNLGDELVRVEQMFQKQAFWAVFVSAFTPIPYKVFTIASGIFSVNIFTFVIAAVLGRGMRFFFEAWLMYAFGEKVAKTVYKSFNTLGIVIVLILVLTFVYIKSF